MAPHILAGACAALTVVIAASACSDSQDGAGGSPALTTIDYRDDGSIQSSDPVVPNWIEEVKPLPDNLATAERVVTVDSRALDATEELRLVLDGIDVTAQALVSEPSDEEPDDRQPTRTSRLRYDPRDVPTEPLVPLGPGAHSATAELRKRPAFGEPSVLVDSYTWSFAIQ